MKSLTVDPHLCIAFDFDGTLVDSNTIKYQMLFETVSHLPGGIRAMETAMADPSLGDRYDIFSRVRELMAPQTVLSQDDLLELLEDYTQKCEAAVMAAPEIPGTAQTLKQLHASGIPLFISSATPEPTLKKIVSGRGLDVFFMDIMGRPRTKEDHIHAIRRSKAGEKRELIYVGDSQSDQSAALSQKCGFIGVGHTPARFDTPPDRLVPDMAGLWSLLTHG